MFTVLGPAAEEILAEWGADGQCAALPPDGHAVFGFEGAPVVVWRASGLGPHVPGWTFIVDESAATEFWRKVALQVCRRCSAWRLGCRAACAVGLGVCCGRSRGLAALIRVHVWHNREGERVQGAIPMGAAVWEQVRVRSGVPAVGAELTDKFNALEAGLHRAISLDKGCYVGQETLSKVTNLNGAPHVLPRAAAHACSAAERVCWLCSA